MAAVHTHVDVADEDAVSYWIFPDWNESEIDDDRLEEFRTKCFTFLSERSGPYIWHEDAINLKPVGPDSTGNIPAHLYGRTRFGCSAEDEWFVVHLLRQLSEEHHDLVIRVVDADGEFLLVEAADYLPRWAKPETCVNRVFLHCGQVHVISVADRPSSLTPLPSGRPSLTHAVHIVRTMPHLTLAPVAIQEPIRQRIDKCAAQVDSSLHRCRVCVPAGVAALLQSYPALVAPAVHAFCQRDASQLAAVRAARFFPPETRVWTSVTFTKCLYAMLVHRNYQPDQRTGWKLPPLGDPKRSGSELGMKLAVGFELLASEEAACRNGSSRSFEQDPRWIRFMVSLKGKGYFQNFLEGSKPYNELLEKAREFFTTSVEEDVPAKEPVVLRLLQSISVDADRFAKEEAHLPCDDDDSWLTVNPESLEEMLGDKFGRLDMLAEESEKSDIIPQLESFLNMTSDYEGLTPAATNGRKKSRKLSHLAPPPRKVSTLSNSSDASQLSNQISFDPDSFNTAMQGILDFAIPEDNWDLESNSSCLSSYSDEEDGHEPQDKDMDTYMAAMDRELRHTDVPITSVDKPARKESVLSEGGESFSDVENFQPVKIDSAALESLLASYTLQHGQPGPASTLLNQLNLTRERLSSDQRKSTN